MLVQNLRKTQSLLTEDVDDIDNVELGIDNHSPSFHKHPNIIAGQRRQPSFQFIGKPLRLSSGVPGVAARCVVTAFPDLEEDCLRAWLILEEDRNWDERNSRG